MKYNLVQFLYAGVVDKDGRPLSLGYFYVTETSSTEPEVGQISVFSDPLGENELEQPVLLNANGSAKVYINADNAKFWIYDKYNRLVDVVSGVQILGREDINFQIFNVTTGIFYATTGNAYYNINTYVDVNFYLPPLQDLNIGDFIRIQKNGTSNTVTIYPRVGDLIRTDLPYLSITSPYGYYEFVVSMQGNNKVYDVKSTDQFVEVARSISGLNVSDVNNGEKNIILTNDRGFISSTFIAQNINYYNNIVSDVDITRASGTTINVNIRRIVFQQADYVVTNLSKTLNVITTGANGLDTGSVANNNWYAIYAIASHDFFSVDIIASLSFEYPSLPQGYSYYQLISCFYYESNAIRPFRQKDDLYFYRTYVALVNTTGAMTNSWTQVTVSNSHLPSYNNKLFAKEVNFAIGTGAIAVGIGINESGFGNAINRSGIPSNTSNLGIFSRAHYKVFSFSCMANSSYYYYSSDSSLEILIMSFRFGYA